jgi:DNA-binding response OmpR family regulator
MSDSNHSICALLVGEYEEDRLLMHETFAEAGWRLLEAPDRKRALRHLDRDPIQVVIASCEVPDWDWKRVLRNLRRMPRPPQLIVTSRTADERLWSEVLNCGGYDVLPRPFRKDEIQRVIAAAHRQYDPQAKIAPQRTTNSSASAA